MQTEPRKHPHLFSPPSRPGPVVSLPPSPRPIGFPIGFPSPAAPRAPGPRWRRWAPGAWREAAWAVPLGKSDRHVLLAQIIHTPHTLRIFCLTQRRYPHCLTQNQADGLKPLGFSTLSGIRKLLEGTLVRLFLFLPFFFPGSQRENGKLHFGGVQTQKAKKTHPSK